ncbi:hypothetical protein HNR62_000286 [Oceanisphaera litoralis]|uniref:hypothetical protein n=1 Tax=Oceanisphaera litoralis TaxID=225144 RepID=UPI00195678E1|nr:hypothetical protein [Oceanisphaera litoralis]MBM7454457.1 hypothetical protein [Oceanisphaera litoralis]
MPTPVGDTLNRNSGILSLVSTMLIAASGMFMQLSFDRLFGDIDRLKQSQAVLQANLDNSISSLQDIRIAVRDSDGRIQNLTIRVSVLEEKLGRDQENHKQGHAK